MRCGSAHANRSRSSARRSRRVIALLALPRGGIFVPAADSAYYSSLVAAIDRHDPGPWIYVWHDSPEIYFLSGRRNPTRTMFEAFDDSLSRTTTDLRGRLEARDVRVVVLSDPDGAERPMADDFRDHKCGGVTFRRSGGTDARQPVALCSCLTT
jgi:hypothetical protein